VVDDDGSEGSIEAASSINSSPFDRTRVSMPPGSSWHAKRWIILLIAGALAIGGAFIVKSVLATLFDPPQPATPRPGAIAIPPGIGPSTTVSTVSTVAPPIVRPAIRLSGKGPRQSALFTLPGGRITVRYTSTTGNLNVRLVQHNTSDPGRVFTCRGVCDTSSIVDIPAGQFYLFVESSGDSSWSVAAGAQ